MKLYQYPKCSTCVKARKYLALKQIDAQIINIAEQAPTLTELESMLASYDGNIKKLFNTSGLQYRELNMKDRLPQMEIADALQLLSSNGMLVKRPFLLKPKGEGLVGFKEADWEDFLS